MTLFSLYLVKQKAHRVNKGIISATQVLNSTVIQFTQTIGVCWSLVVVRDASWFVMTGLNTVEPVSGV